MQLLYLINSFNQLAPMFFKLLLFSLLLISATPTDHFQSDVQRAVETLRTKKKAINQFDNGLSTDENRTALSIVFPEVIRYNSFSDFIETKTLEWVYVDYGAEKACKGVPFCFNSTSTIFLALSHAPPAFAMKMA